MSEKMDMVKPFEFTLKINNNIICKRYFNIRNYNEDCRESLEMKEMMDDIMGVSQDIKLGVIPEYLKILCMENSHKPYYSQNNHFTNKNDIFYLDVTKNNISKIRRENKDISYLQHEILASGTFNGTLFHPNVRYSINVKPIIPEIVKVINRYMALDEYTMAYGDASLSRYNKL